jgi:hypothetical protein
MLFHLYQFPRNLPIVYQPFIGFLAKPLLSIVFHPKLVKISCCPWFFTTFATEISDFERKSIGKIDLRKHYTQNSRQLIPKKKYVKNDDQKV